MGATVSSVNWFSLPQMRTGNQIRKQPDNVSEEMCRKTTRELKEKHKLWTLATHEKIPVIHEKFWTQNLESESTPTVRGQIVKMHSMRTCIHCDGASLKSLHLCWKEQEKNVHSGWGGKVKMMMMFLLCSLNHALSKVKSPTFCWLSYFFNASK